MKTLLTTLCLSLAAAISASAQAPSDIAIYKRVITFTSTNQSQKNSLPVVATTGNAKSAAIFTSTRYEIIDLTTNQIVIVKSYPKTKEYIVGAVTASSTGYSKMKLKTPVGAVLWYNGSSEAVEAAEDYDPSPDAPDGIIDYTTTFNSVTHDFGIATLFKATPTRPMVVPATITVKGNGSEMYDDTFGVGESGVFTNVITGTAVLDKAMTTKAVSGPNIVDGVTTLTHSTLAYGLKLVTNSLVGFSEVAE